MKKYYLIAVVLVAAGLVSILSWMNQSNSGDIYSSPNNDVLSASKTTTSLQSDLFSTYYDSSLRIKTSTNDGSGPIYTQILLASKDDEEDTQIGITVAASDGGVEEASPAKLRLLQSDQYQKMIIPFAPDGSLVFTKNSDSNYEIAVIWQADEHYAAVVGSGTNADRLTIYEQVSDVVSNWQWRN